MRWLKPVPAEALAMDPPPAPLCWMEDGWVSSETMDAEMADAEEEA
jgi:hypothetical protein